MMDAHGCGPIGNYPLPRVADIETYRRYGATVVPQDVVAGIRARIVVDPESKTDGENVSGEPLAAEECPYGERCGDMLIRYQRQPAVRNVGCDVETAKSPIGRIESDLCVYSEPV